MNLQGYFTKWLLFIIPLSTLSVRSSAQFSDSTIPMLDSVVVTGNRTPLEIVPVQKLSGRALSELSVHSVADAIRYFSGAQVKDYGGIGGLKTVNIRSLGSQHVGVFYDGIEMSDAQNGVVDLGRLSLDNISSISLYNGQKSAIFQPAKDFASANSIYLASQIPSFEDSLKNNKYKINLRAGSFGTINPSILWQHRLSKKLSFTLSGEYLYTKGNYLFTYQKKDSYDTTERRKNDDVRYLRLEGNLYGAIKEGEWKAKLYWYNSQRGYPGAAVRQNPGLFPHEDRQWDNNIFLQGSWKKKLSDFYSLQLSGKYANSYLHYLSDPRQDISTMYVNNTFRQQEIYLSSAQLFRILPFWDINLSGDFQLNTLNANLVDFVYPKRYTELAAVASSFDFDRFKLQGSLLGTFVHEKTNDKKKASKDKQQYTPSLIADYRPFKNQDLHLRAFYKRIFRMPTLNDLYYTFVGNKNLDPEYTTQYDLGFSYAKSFHQKALKRVEGQVDAYFNQVKNKIIAMPTSNQFRWTMLNLGYTEIRGLDVSMQADWQVTDSLGINTRLSYTYQKAQDFTDKSSPFYGGQIPYIPWHSGSLIINAMYKTWSLSYSYIYTGERYSVVANIPANYVKPWYTHDISLSKRLQIKNKPCRITLELNNLLNQQYEVVQWYPMPGTNFKTIFSIDL